MLRFWIRTGKVVRIAHGVYVNSGQLVSDFSRATISGKQVMGFAQAAELFGIAKPIQLPTRATCPTRLSRIDPKHIQEIDGVKAPSIGWTAINLARFQNLPNALIPLDSALRLGISLVELTELLVEVKGGRGTANLAKAVALADRKSESALESYTRGVLTLEGAPPPLLQYEVQANRRNYRVDFAWPEKAVILEVDGLMKYTRQKDLVLEKKRQSDLQLHGYEVWRCIWADVLHPNQIVIRKLCQRLC